MFIPFVSSHSQLVILIRYNMKILAAREYISKNIEPDSPLLEVYLTDLLECIVAKGDVQENEPKRQSDLEVSFLLFFQFILH